jgi:hypothetical protein
VNFAAACLALTSGRITPHTYATCPGFPASQQQLVAGGAVCTKTFPTADLRRREPRERQPLLREREGETARMDTLTLSDGLSGPHSRVSSVLFLSCLPSPALQLRRLSVLQANASACPVVHLCMVALFDACKRRTCVPFAVLCFQAVGPRFLQTGGAHFVRFVLSKYSSIQGQSLEFFVLSPLLPADQLELAAVCVCAILLLSCAAANTCLRLCHLSHTPTPSHTLGSRQYSPVLSPTYKSASCPLYRQPTPCTQENHSQDCHGR